MEPVQKIWLEFYHLPKSLATTLLNKAEYFFIKTMKNYR